MEEKSSNPKRMDKKYKTIIIVLIVLLFVVTVGIIIALKKLEPTTPEQSYPYEKAEDISEALEKTSEFYHSEKSDSVTKTIEYLDSQIAQFDNEENRNDLRIQKLAIITALLKQESYDNVQEKIQNIENEINEASLTESQKERFYNVMMIVYADMHNLEKNKYYAEKSAKQYEENK